MRSCIKKIMTLPAVWYAFYMLAVPVMAAAAENPGPVSDEAKPVPYVFVIGLVALAAIVSLLIFRPGKK